MYTWIDMYFFCCFTIFISLISLLILWFFFLFPFTAPGFGWGFFFQSSHTPDCALLSSAPGTTAPWMEGVRRRRRKRKRDGYTHHGVLFCSSTNVDEKKKKEGSRPIFRRIAFLLHRWTVSILSWFSPSLSLFLSGSFYSMTSFFFFFFPSCLLIFLVNILHPMDGWDKSRWFRWGE